METEGTIIYVAGNPDLYPAEYYDAQSGTYQGAIPDFLRAFAEEYGYDLRYLRPGEEDLREELAKNQQVDVISGCEPGAAYAHTAGQPLLLFPGEGGAYYTLYLTQVASPQVQSDLRAYVEATAQGEWTEAILQAAGDAPAQPLPAWALWGGLVLLLALAAAVGVLLRQRWKEKRRAKLIPADPETGLGSLEELEDAFTRIAGDQSRPSYSLICFHLALEEIGRLRGYDQAKEVLRQGGQILREAAGGSDILARRGEDLLALKRAATPQEAVQWAEDVLAKLRACAGGLRFQDAGAGVFPLAAEYNDFGHTLFHAGQCARRACREGEGLRTCATGQCAACRERWALLEDFTQAIAQNEIQLYFQFFADVNTFQVVGGEALSRWYHPKLGLLNPVRYIPLLEEAGRIGELDLYGMEKVCAFLEELGKQGIESFFISCNFARKTMAAPDFAQRCIQIVQRYQFPPKLLILEVTESQSMSPAEQEQLRENIEAVRAQGMRVIFDDFGAGFSSFRDLQSYPMDGLKLDKELVDHMDTDQGRIILRALVEAGHRMGFTILAEGVENDSQIDTLRQLRCDAFQGYRSSVPLPEAEARKRITQGAHLADFTPVPLPPQ